ncbi:MAG: hypothetical protein Alpg2KO_14110 [Alphaproteobacteria bacterium]
MSSLPTARFKVSKNCNADDGVVRWDAAKSIWAGGMAGVAIGLGPLTFSWSALVVFMGLTALTICLGHSLGMHRLLIHRSFKAPLWLERLMVWLGTLVGMAGPIGMIRLHDMRDWAQRQKTCHDYHAHRTSMVRDYWWQVHCRLDLTHPPIFDLEERVAEDPYYRWVERYWMAQQIPVAIILFALGGWGWVVWGICVRVTASLFGHWLIGHLAHRRGPQDWTIDDTAVQGHNVPAAALISFGEAWHCNHHAFPDSARMGLLSGQHDPGWWVLRLLKALRLVSHLNEPRHVQQRKGLRPKSPDTLQQVMQTGVADARSGKSGGGDLPLEVQAASQAGQSCN